MIIDCNKATTNLVLFHIVVTFELVFQICIVKYCVHFIIFPSLSFLYLQPEQNPFMLQAE